MSAPNPNPELTGSVLASPPGESRPTGRRRSLNRVLDYGILISFAAIFVYLSLASDAFLTSGNLQNILNQQSGVLIVAVAATLVIVAGGFDLSVGAIFALAGVVSAKVAVSTGTIPAILAGCAVGIVMGACNGGLVTVGRINSLIGTLSTSFIFRGIATVITSGALVIVSDKSFGTLGKDEILGIHVAIWIAIAFTAAIWFVLARTVYGRHIYAVGDNPEAARLAGVRVEWIRASTFILSGFAAGLAGVVASSRFGTGQADAGVGLEFTVIASVVVGGTSIAGGEGAVWRTVVGVLLIAMIGNGFTLLSINPIYQQIVQGMIILGAVGVDAWTRRERT